MKNDEISKLNDNLKTVRRGGFFVYYMDKRKPEDSAGHNLVITRKVGEAMLAFRTNRKTDTRIVKGVIRYDAASKIFNFELEDTSGIPRIRRGLRILASNGANLLRKVRFPEAAEDETESTPQISNEEDQELGAALDADDFGPESDAVEQDLLESFMEDFLRVTPDEELSHEQAFESFRSDWQEGVSIFNNALKALYKNVKQNIMELNEDDQGEFKSKAREYQAKLKSAMFSDADPINSALSELEQNARQVSHLKEALKLARANTKHITDNETVKHLRACPTMSIRGDVKRCLLIMEKTVVQIQAVRAEL